MQLCSSWSGSPEGPAKMSRGKERHCSSVLLRLQLEGRAQFWAPKDEIYGNSPVEATKIIRTFKHRSCGDRQWVCLLWRTGAQGVGNLTSAVEWKGQRRWSWAHFKGAQ